MPWDEQDEKTWKDMDMCYETVDHMLHKMEATTAEGHAKTAAVAHDTGAAGADANTTAAAPAPAGDAAEEFDWEGCFKCVEEHAEAPKKLGKKRSVKKAAKKLLKECKAKCPGEPGIAHEVCHQAWHENVDYEKLDKCHEHVEAFLAKKFGAGGKLAGS